MNTSSDCAKENPDGNISRNEELPRHFRTSFIVIALCCAGPFALPLVWKRPNTSLKWKIAITTAVVLITALLCLILYLAIMMLIGLIKECYQLTEEL